MKNDIFKMYQTISIGKNEICNVCNKNKTMEKPLSLYFVGNKFAEGNDTILFVGKTAVGGEDFEEEYKGDFDNDLFTDSTKFGEKSLDLTEKWATSRPFYLYTNNIISDYYGSYEIGKEFVALTNIVKCNNTTTNDTTDYQIKENCINKLAVIWKEIEMLSPKRVVFYTNVYYDDFIDAYRPNNCTKIEDISDIRIEIGNKTTPWWHRRFLDDRGNIITEFLRLGHPQMMNKMDYIKSVVNWLKITK